MVSRSTEASATRSATWARGPAARRPIRPRDATPERLCAAPAARERIDFDDQADELVTDCSGTAIISSATRTAASWRSSPPRVGRGARRSLAVNEPPAFGVARGDPAVDAFVQSYLDFLAAGPHTPEEYARSFLPLVGASVPPGKLSPTLEQGAAAALAERPPNEAVIPLEALAAAPFPKLIVSGGHHAAFDAVCDVLEVRLGAERAILPAPATRSRARRATTTCWSRSCGLRRTARRSRGSHACAPLLAAPDDRVRELHDLEQVDDVDRGGERRRARSRRPRLAHGCQSPCGCGG